jgi:DNA mismatch repair protein MLH1
LILKLVNYFLLISKSTNKCCILYRKVRFLYQDEIINKIQTRFEQNFLASNSSRTYYVQNLTLEAYIPGVDSEKSKKGNESMENKKASSQTGGSSPVIYPYQLARVDSKEQKLESFMHQTSLDKSIRNMKENNRSFTIKDDDSIRSQLRNQNLARLIDLKSLSELKSSVEKRTSKEILKILQDMSFVGCMERELALVQHQTSLYLLNTSLLSQELFYQICLFGLGNFGYFRLEHPLLLYDLFLTAMYNPDADWTPDDGPREVLAKKCAKFLNSRGTFHFFYRALYRFYWPNYSIFNKIFNIVIYCFFYKILIFQNIFKFIINL